MHEGNRGKSLIKRPEPQPSASDVCDVPVVHVEKVRALKDHLLPADTRASIVHVLAKEELCVCDLAAVLRMSVSAVSHHLRILRNLRLVKFRKKGRMVYYSLDDVHVIRIFTEGVQHVKEE